jgi:hypothetical protein
MIGCLVGTGCDEETQYEYEYANDANRKVTSERSYNAYNGTDYPYYEGYPSKHKYTLQLGILII